MLYIYITYIFGFVRKGRYKKKWNVNLASWFRINWILVSWPRSSPAKRMNEWHESKDLTHSESINDKTLKRYPLSRNN